MRLIPQTLIALALLLSVLSCKEGNLFPLKDLMFIKKEGDIEKDEEINTDPSRVKITDYKSSQSIWYYSDRDSKRGITYKPSINNPTKFNDVDGVWTSIYFDAQQYQSYEIQLPVTELHGAAQINLTSEKNNLEFVISPNPKFVKISLEPVASPQYVVDILDTEYVSLAIRKENNEVHVYVNKKKIVVVDAKNVNFTNPTLTIRPLAKSSLNYIPYAFYEIRA